jgi:hypothetical protein
MTSRILMIKSLIFQCGLTFWDFHALHFHCVRFGIALETRLLAFVDWKVEIDTRIDLYLVLLVCYLSSVGAGDGRW